MTALLDRIRARIAHSTPIAVLCAPPGFGKQQLLSDLWHEKSSEGTAAFFDRIDHLEDPKASSQAILQRDGVTTVFIGDLAHCDIEYLGLALDRLVRTSSDRRVFLAMDTPSALDLGRHRTAGNVEWIGSDTLTYNERETRERFAKIGSVEDRRRLAALAGYWPIAVDMLVDWALRSSTELRGLSDQDILQESGLFEFISAQIWTLCNDLERKVLSRAALLTQPKRSLLENAQGHDRILAMLSVKLAGLIEQSGDLITLNRALQLFVCERALLDDPHRQIGMMIDLAERSSSQGSLSDAARLVAAAGEPERIAKIAEQHGALLIWVLCGFSDLHSLVKNAGDDVVAGSPVLRMLSCIVDLKLGRIGQAQAELERLASDTAIADTMKTQIEIIRVTLLVYGCSLARQHDIELLADLLAEQSDEPAWQSFLATLSCILNSQRGRFETANANLLEARHEAERAGSRYNVMFLFLHEAGIHIAQGALTKARSAIAAARKIWRREFVADIGVETVIAALSAKVEFETGRLTSARNALRKSANRLPDGEAWFDIYFAAYEPMARVHVREQGLPRALELLQAEKAKLDARGLGRVGRLLDGLGFCLAGEARLRGDPQADDVSTSFVKPDEIWSWQEHETFNLASAYDLGSQGREIDAIAMLREANRSAAERNLLHSQFRYSLALFLFSHRTDRRAEALECLKETIILAHQTGMRLVAQDVIGATVGSYYEQLIASGALNEGEIKTLTEIRRGQEDHRSPIAGLSKRELDVVGALAEGGSDKEIARQLEISDHGVRYHLKNIFRKLGVHDRLAAVLSAQQKGWV